MNFFCTIKAKNKVNRRVTEIQIFEKTYFIVLKDDTGLKFKINVSTLFLIGSLKIGSIILKNGEISQCLQKTETFSKAFKLIFID